MNFLLLLIASVLAAPGVYSGNVRLAQAPLALEQVQAIQYVVQAIEPAVTGSSDASGEYWWFSNTPTLQLPVT